MKLNPAQQIFSFLSSGGKYPWRFFRAGGLNQACLESGADLAALNDLDKKLWVALSCPTRGLEFDNKTLDLIDTDRDGRIRVPEMIAATKWACGLLKNPDELLAPKESLLLSAINDQTDAGARILASAKRILRELGKADPTSISVAEVTDTAKIFAATKFNGDGVVPADSSSEAAVQLVITEIATTLGAVTDRSGKPGINLEKCEAFFNQAKALADWNAAAESSIEISPLGKQTPDAYALFKHVRTKIEDYFTRCRLVAFDARAAIPMNRSESEYVIMAPKDLTLASEEIARLPLSPIAAGKALILDASINPAWAVAMDQFRRSVITPLLGADKLQVTEGEWRSICATFAPHEKWLSIKPTVVVEKLGLARLQEILRGNARDSIHALIQEDLMLEPEHKEIATVERLVRYYRDLNTLVHNYVNFADFYHPEEPAIFQAGRLYIDGRSCDLCFSIEDAGKHATLASAGGIYLAYCELTRVSTGQKRNICAAFTAGFAESLWVGRNGIFYDRAGQDWDATIIKVVEHQISLKEAFWSPWKKIARMISDQINKILAAREAAALSAAGKTVDEAGKTIDAGKPATAAGQSAASGAAMASSVAAIGIAVGLLGSALGELLKFVKGATLLNMILGVICVVGAVSLPSVLIAYFKLRRRDLAPVLNACGWAINSQIKLTLKLGTVLTQEATLPPGAARRLTDPYADNNARRNFWLTTLLIVTSIFLWYIGQLDPVLPHRAKSIHVLGTNAPAYQPPVATPVVLSATPTNAPVKTTPVASGTNSP
jgi:hypothetical protein